MSNFRLSNINSGVSIQINSQGFVYDYQEPSYVSSGDLVLLTRDNQSTTQVTGVFMECLESGNWQFCNEAIMPNPYHAFQVYELLPSGDCLSFNTVSGSNNFNDCPSAPWYC